MASSNELTGQAPFSWGRTSALAVAIAVHAVGFLMLVAPATPPKQQEKEKERVVNVDFIEPPPPTPPPAVEEATTNPQPAPPPAPPAPPAPPSAIEASSDLSYQSRNPPKYPPQAVRQRHEGTVVLLVLVAVDGSAKDVKVDKSSGFRELDQAAVQAAQRWKFNPAKRGGQIVEGYARVPVTFNLSQT